MQSKVCKPYSIEKHFYSNYVSCKWQRHGMVNILNICIYILYIYPIYIYMIQTRNTNLYDPLPKGTAACCCQPGEWTPTMDASSCNSTFRNDQRHLHLISVVVRVLVKGLKRSATAFWGYCIQRETGSACHQYICFWSKSSATHGLQKQPNAPPKGQNKPYLK